MIGGGYYIKARKIQKSTIAHMPPHVREIWDWILMNANHADKTYMGKTIKRGEVLTSYKRIIDDLSWKVGYRTVRYKKYHCEIAMKLLTNESMIQTTRTTRGFLIQVVNYCQYQDPSNYESDSETETKRKRNVQSNDTINKNVKNEKKEKKTIQGDFDNFIKTFNELTRKQYRATDGLRAKYNTRRKTFSVEEIERAMRALVVSPYHTGKNDRGMYYATPEFLLRSDEQVDKWLNFKSFAKKPQEKDKLLELAIKNGITIEN